LQYIISAYKHSEVNSTGKWLLSGKVKKNLEKNIQVVFWAGKYIH